MKILKIFTILLLSSITLICVGQTEQHKTVKFNPVKKDSTGSNAKELKKYSTEQMFKGVTPAKTITDPKEKEAMDLYQAGSEKGRQGDYKGAIDEFTKSLNIKKNGNTYMKRGYTYMLMENYPLGIQDLNEALKLQPGYAKALFARGVCEFEMKDLKDAEADLSNCVEIDRTNPIAFNYLAAIKFLNKDYKAALENYNEVAKLSPSYPDVYTNRGMMRHFLGDYKGAIEDYNEALRRNPNNPTGYNNRGGARLNMKEFKEALDDFNTAIKLKDDYADAYNNRGRAKINLGDKTGACDDWHKAYSLGIPEVMQLIMKYCN
jgi:tetratricopeptide (TPR) repeat protein